MLFADNISKRATTLDVVGPVVPSDSDSGLEVFGMLPLKLLPSEKRRKLCFLCTSPCLTPYMV